MKSGFVSIVGRTNVGKSTLLNSILNQKIAIVSDKVQTTRNIIQGIYDDEETQIVFLDTPGVHKPKHKLGKVLNKQAFNSVYEVDVIYFVVDASVEFGKGDKFVLDFLKRKEKPIILVLNKIDKIAKNKLLPLIEEYQNMYNFKEIVPVSGIKKDNIERLVEVTKKYLNDNIKYFDSDKKTSNSQEFIISEIVREKILELTNEEIPHSVTCVVENLFLEKEIYSIQVLVIVDRENLKKIIIGSNGNMIKQIGIKVREEIEPILNKKVYLELYVKVIKNWRNKNKQLLELGFQNRLK